MVPSTSGSFLAIAWRGRWIVLVCTVAALAVGLVYINAATPIYTSTAKLYLHCETIQISPYEAGGVPRTDKYLHTQAEILRSRGILTAALGTDEDPPLRTFEDAEIPLAFLRKTMVITVGRKDETIRVSFDSPYPVEAAQIVNRVVEAYMISRSESERKDANKVLRIFESQLSQCQEELKVKTTELREFRAKKMPVSLGMDDGVSVTQGHLECKRAYRQAQQAASEAKQYRDGVRALAESPKALRQYAQARSKVSQFGNSTPGQLALEATLAELDRKRGDLLRGLTEDHSSVVAIDAEKERVAVELADLNAQFVSATIMAAERQYEEAKVNEEGLARQYEAESQKVRQLSAELQQLHLLRAEVDRLDAAVTTFDREVSEIRKIVDEDTGRMRMAKLEPALPARNPSAPQKGKVMALALMLGLAAGGGIAVIRDWVDQTFRSIEEISVALELPVLGFVPAMSRRQPVSSRGQKVLRQPASPEAEAYRTVRTALFFGTPAKEMQTLLITSPAAGDGKSTLVGNLGIAMAQVGQNTLVLDADLRKPMQHIIFSVDHHERCLSNVFAGRMELREAIQPTQAKGLSLLTCGYDVSNPAELLSSQRFAKLLENLARHYDCVLVDAPPVTVVTDAQILGALCDYTVLVMRADKSSRRIARRAVEALDGVGANLFGVVINGVRSGGDTYGYYGRYGNSYSGNGGNGKSEEDKIRGGARQKASSPNLTRSC